MPSEHAPHSSDTLLFGSGATPHPGPLLPPLTLPSVTPKNTPVVLPTNVEDAEVVGVKVMLVGDADKLDPVNVADVPEIENGDAPDSDNDHDTRVDEVTLQESQLSTMSPVTAVE
jgi:hypothetical protein